MSSAMTLPPSAVIYLINRIVRLSATTIQTTAGLPDVSPEAVHALRIQSNAVARSLSLTARDGSVTLLVSNYTHTWLRATIYARFTDSEAARVPIGTMTDLFQVQMRHHIKTLKPELYGTVLWDSLDEYSRFTLTEGDMLFNMIWRVVRAVYQYLRHTEYREAAKPPCAHRIAHLPMIGAETVAELGRVLMERENDHTHGSTDDTLFAVYALRNELRQYLAVSDMEFAYALGLAAGAHAWLRVALEGVITAASPGASVLPSALGGLQHRMWHLGRGHLAVLCEMERYVDEWNAAEEAARLANESWYDEGEGEGEVEVQEMDEEQRVGL
ncbi:hypothetical protein ANO11243_077890 [Dothideomycetidae sp. 11243]|nr:hypothetical protein ANO11243_077890 [fungal sp. No.11243]